MQSRRQLEERMRKLQRQLEVVPYLTRRHQKAVCGRCGHSNATTTSITVWGAAVVWFLCGTVAGVARSIHSTACHGSSATP